VGGEPSKPELHDLDLIAGDVPPEEVAAGSPPPKSEPYDPLPERENVRGQIAQALIVLLAMLILFAFLTLWCFPSSSANLKDLLTLLFGPVAALVGSAIGFYFGGSGIGSVQK
jgi:hypothetical protein